MSTESIALGGDLNQAHLKGAGRRIMEAWMAQDICTYRYVAARKASSVVEMPDLEALDGTEEQQGDVGLFLDWPVNTWSRGSENGWEIEERDAATQIDARKSREKKRNANGRRMGGRM